MHHSFRTFTSESQPYEWTPFIFTDAKSRSASFVQSKFSRNSRACPSMSTLLRSPSLSLEDEDIASSLMAMYVTIK